jgi:endoglucanase
MIRWCRERLGEFADGVKVDIRGNVHATFGPAGGGPRLALAAHMDALGMVVRTIHEHGFIRFSGGAEGLAMCSRRVWVHGTRGPVLGVIGIRTGYGTSTEEQRSRVPATSDMYVDVGCGSREAVADLGIRLGDPITFDGDLAALGDPCRVVGPSLDNRAGIALMTVLAADMRGIAPRPEVTLLATVEEEVGCRGVATAVFQVAPEVGISLDTQPAGGTPEYPFESLPVLIGCGPVIKFMESGRTPNHPRVRRLLMDAAEKAQAPYQLAAAPPGNTDMGPMQLSGMGVAAAALGIPRRYAHSPNEVVDLRDLDAARAILREAIRMLGEGYSLSRA